MANDKERTKQPDGQFQPQQPVQAHQSPQTTKPADSPTPILSQRSLKQLGLFFAGAGFLSLSLIITRRAVTRKLVATTPQFYQPSNRPVSRIQSDSSLIAFEALHLATLNVIGFGMMVTGGAAWAFDISGVDDLRRMARRHIGPPGGQTDEEAEREVEEWVAKILSRKDEREKEAKTSSGKDD
ncbi:hypothetical protein F4779DRAFT_615635 [Xylariaceae sp. FL0662B]|nr:hypothetical protein F4779DRAFT_615635 [Xylariaceae sp. FL0662B]